MGFRHCYKTTVYKHLYDTVCHAPLAIDRLLDVRTTKWQKQLPTTMQCRSHSRRPTIECLFVTACSMHQYAEEKTTENLIVRSGISEAETTNNKRLRLTFCIEAIQTRSIAQPFCDSKASCIMLIVTDIRYMYDGSFDYCRHPTQALSLGWQCGGCATLDPDGSNAEQEVSNLADSQHGTAEYQAERSADLTQQSKNRVRRLRLNVRVL